MGLHFNPKLSGIMAGLACALTMAMPVFAAVDNPSTGDAQGQYMGIVIAALAISLVVIITIAVISARGKKKKKK